MDDRLKVQFLRAQAHDCRMRASLMQHAEHDRRWLDLARDYEQQADDIERQSSFLAKRTGTPED